MPREASPEADGRGGASGGRGGTPGGSRDAGLRRGTTTNRRATPSSAAPGLIRSRSISQVGAGGAGGDVVVLVGVPGAVVDDFCWTWGAGGGWVLAASFAVTLPK